MRTVVLIASSKTKIPKNLIAKLRSNNLIALTSQAAIAIEKLDLPFDTLKAPNTKKLSRIQAKLDNAIIQKNTFIISLFKNFIVWELQKWYFNYQQIKEIAKKSKSVKYLIFGHREAPKEWLIIGNLIKKQITKKCSFQIILR